MRAVVAAVAVIVMGCGASTTPIAPPASAEPQRPVAAATPPPGPEWIEHGRPRCSPEPPTSPAIDTPWVAPDGLDVELARWLETNVVGTAVDPRGLEYRAVRIQNRPDGALWETTGFVSPGRGVPLALVHGEWWPAWSIGPARDVVAGCERAFAILTARTALPEPEAIFDRLSRTEWSDCPGAGAVVWLAAEGHSDLALRLAAVIDVDELAVAPARYSRALTAYASADDCLALRELRALAAEADAAEARRERLRWDVFPVRLGAGAPEIQLVRALLQELERRARDPLPALELERDAPVPPERIPELIRVLEDVGAPYSDASRAPWALERAGLAAVPALLDVIEHDERLTRQLFGLRFWEISVISVADEAYDIVTRIIGVPPAPPRLADEPYDPTRMLVERIARARARWAEIQAMSPEERERWWAERARR